MLQLVWKYKKCPDVLYLYAFLHHSDHPRPLSSWCRLVIRQSVGRQRLSLLDTLPLPAALLQYLTYDSLDIPQHGEWDTRQVVAP